MRRGRRAPSADRRSGARHPACPGPPSRQRPVGRGGRAGSGRRRRAARRAGATRAGCRRARRLLRRRIETIPCEAQRRIAAVTSTRPSAEVGARRTTQPASTSTCSALGRVGAVSTQVGTSRAVWTRRVWSGSLSRVSKTSRMGLRPAGASAGSRRVSRGSSASAVPIPIATASWRERSSWTLARASGPVTHFEAPVRVAMRPSSDRASLSAMWGMPVVMNLVQGAISAEPRRRPRRAPRRGRRR